jgi:predicted adenylyl cyclase CyaB
VAHSGLNLEMKARDPDPEYSRAALADLGAVRQASIRQSDTFFETDSCDTYLKVRDENPGSPHLIRYTRARDKRIRLSNYSITPVEDLAAVLAELASRLGVVGEVRKTRELWLLKNARIHLDQVCELGDFLEIEVVADGTRLEKSDNALMARIQQRLAIAGECLVSGPYLELLA